MGRISKYYLATSSKKYPNNLLFIRNYCKFSFTWKSVDFSIRAGCVFDFPQTTSGESLQWLLFLYYGVPGELLIVFVWQGDHIHNSPLGRGINE
jgi:hypothetical protein